MFRSCPSSKDVVSCYNISPIPCVRKPACHCIRIWKQGAVNIMRRRRATLIFWTIQNKLLPLISKPQTVRHASSGIDLLTTAETSLKCPSRVDTVEACRSSLAVPSSSQGYIWVIHTLKDPSRGNLHPFLHHLWQHFSAIPVRETLADESRFLYDHNLSPLSPLVHGSSRTLSPFAASLPA